MRGEVVISRSRRIASGLSVRGDEDGVRVTTRKTVLRALFALVLGGGAWLAWHLWREGMLQDMTTAGIVTLAALVALLLLPLLMLGTVYALPGERLLASRSGGRLELESLWFVMPVRTRHIEIADCHRVLMTELSTQETVTDDSSDPSNAATLLGALLGGAGSWFDPLVTWLRRERRTVLVPVYGIEIVLRDGSSVTGLLTRNDEHVQRALHAVWEVFPQLEPRPLADEVAKDLQPAARVRVSLDHHWARGAMGAVAEPPPAVREYGGDWEGHRRRVGMLVYYWIEFDEPQEEPGSDRPVKAGEMDSRFLEPI